MGTNEGTRPFNHVGTLFHGGSLAVLPSLDGLSTKVMVEIR